MSAVRTRELLPLVDGALRSARELLLEQRGPGGHWSGELSSSALSTATAIGAFALARDASAADARRLEPMIRAGVRWLAHHASPDGGFGDTADSPSNLSTTALVATALALALERNLGDDEAQRACSGARAWIEHHVGGELDAARLASALAEVYGEDRTFAVPILTFCALGPLMGEQPWRSVPRLPFELAALPQGLFRFLELSVVSYALPALIAIGHAIEHHRPTRNPLTRGLRAATRAHTLRVLERIQPRNGGFLEATPLTSFVVMSLVSIGAGESTVARRGLDFLERSARADGSWPIDTNLATWVTTLATNALGDALDEDARGGVLSWLLAQQHLERHPYTGAAPGGWAWTDLPGGVPDADDTPGALLALRSLVAPGTPGEERATERARRGLRWLIGLQNKDGGIPTFCRGWGRLPFDQSSPDLTAHMLRACAAWPGALDTTRAARRARAYLVRAQRTDGAWVPLWFGCQDEPRQENPVHGTSRVLRAATTGPGDAEFRAALGRGLDWLVAAQGGDGGFGGGPDVVPSIEETALALEGLADARLAGLGDERTDQAIARAAEWLVRVTEVGTRFEARPIGLYFAKLWYSERLYPLVFSTAALARAREALAR